MDGPLTAAYLRYGAGIEGRVEVDEVDAIVGHRAEGGRLSLMTRVRFITGQHRDVEGAVAVDSVETLRVAGIAFSVMEV